MNLNYSMASWEEWRFACQKSGLSPALQNMTNNWEWVRDINNKTSRYDYVGGYVVGNGGCHKSDATGNPNTAPDKTWSYRCVFYR